MHHHQRGATLVMGMIFLAILMLAVTASFTLSTNNLKAVGNMQSRAEAAAAIDRAVETLISSTAIFSRPVATTLAVDAYGNVVIIEKPECIRSVALTTETSADSVSNIYQEGIVNLAATDFVETYWDIHATATNGSTGARVETHQGIKIILPADPNPC